MEDPQVFITDGAGQESGSLSVTSEASVVTSVGRQLEERLSRIHQGGISQPYLPEQLLFWIDSRPYTAALTSLREVLSAIPKVTPLPFSPSWLVGLFPFRTDLVTLIDLRPFLSDSISGVTMNAQLAPMLGEQALLIGETGRLIAFAVDRIGDIIIAPNEVASHLDNELSKVRTPLQEVEEITSPRNEDQAAVVALHVANLYEDVIGKLEEWAFNA